MRDPVKLSQILLTWYDRNARSLPWRVPPGHLRDGDSPDPYSVWLSEIMLQQTTVQVVSRYFEQFCNRWPRIENLAAARDRDVMAAWAGLGYYARARNLIKCARIVTDRFGGDFPRSEAELMTLPGIGPYTAAAIAAIAFNLPAVAVDGNVERVVARLHAFRDPLPEAKPKLRKLARCLEPTSRPGDFSQAMMDLGSLVCRPRRPDCANCPWNGSCKARKLGIEREIPVRQARTANPEVKGLAYVGWREDGAWLVEQRPDGGLLGGMPGWPGSGWGHEVEAGIPCDGDWFRLDDVVHHGFTHFKLELAVLVARIPESGVAIRGEFVPEDAFDPKSMPTLMRKVFDLASPVLMADLRLSSRTPITISGQS